MMSGMGRRLRRLGAKRRVVSRAMHDLRDDARYRTAEAPLLTPTYPFETFDDPVAGRVHGYRDVEPGASAPDPYVAFQDVFRGPEELVRERLRCYLPLLEGRGPVLDAGCGRGELLDLLRDSGLEASGVDASPAMVELASGKGHAVELGDVNDHLERQADGSLGTIFSAQLIEHLPVAALDRFFELAAAKLTPNGLLIAETVNPYYARAARHFWLDPTHQHPLYPETLLVFCRARGFRSAFFFHPNESGDVSRDRFHSFDYAIVAEKGGPPG
jgi:SAM-dependent methyltransferase